MFYKDTIMIWLIHLQLLNYCNTFYNKYYQKEILLSLLLLLQIVCIHYRNTNIPQLIVIHIHQVFRVQYTLVWSDTGNIYWWCVNLCRVYVSYEISVTK